MSQVTVRSVVYQIDGQSYESRLAFDARHLALPVNRSERALKQFLRAAQRDAHLGRWHSRQLARPCLCA